MLIKHTDHRGNEQSCWRTMFQSYLRLTKIHLLSKRPYRSQIELTKLDGKQLQQLPTSLVITYLYHFFSWRSMDSNNQYASFMAIWTTGFLMSCFSFSTLSFLYPLPHLHYFKSCDTAMFSFVFQSHMSWVSKVIIDKIFGSGLFFYEQPGLLQLIQKMIRQYLKLEF